MVRSLAKHSGFFKKKDKNMIPETDMQENVAQMMEEPMDQDPVQEDADIADTDMNDIGVQETAVDAGNAVDEADIADDDTETSEDLDDTDRNSQAAEEYEETGNIIDCDSLVKIYKTDEVEVMALQGLELTIKKGELMAVIGKSGSGKSTLLNMIGGLERPTAGKLYVDGKDLFAMTDKELVEYRKHTVGFVWQKNSRNLLPYMTALENVQVPMYFDKDNKLKSELNYGIVDMEAGRELPLDEAMEKITELRNVFRGLEKIEKLDEATLELYSLLGQGYNAMQEGRESSIDEVKAQIRKRREQRVNR